jgi:hypothetical protein
VIFVLEAVQMEVDGLINGGGSMSQVLKNLERLANIP